MGNWSSFAVVLSPILIKSDIEAVQSEGQTRTRTIIGYIALPLAPKCIWQLPAPLRRTAWSTHSYNRHLNKWECWRKLNERTADAASLLPRMRINILPHVGGILFPWARKVSSHCFTHILRFLLFILPFSCPSRRTRVCWVDAEAVRALNASVFRSISWLASLWLHVS